MNPGVLIRCLVALWMLIASGVAGAQSCILSPASATLTGYNTSTNLLSAVLTVGYTCTRDKNGASMNMTVVAGQGPNYVSPKRRARITATANYMNFDLLRTTTLTDYWGSGAVPPGSNTMSVPVPNNLFPTGNATSVSGTFNYYVNFPAGQTPVVGTYTEQVPLTGSCTEASGQSGNVSNCASFTGSTLTVNLVVSSANCSIGIVPNMTMAYTSFQTVNSQGVSNFTVNCTSGTSYWMSLNSVAASQAVATTTVNSTASNNLNYNLSVPTGSQSGTGAQQNWSVTGAVPANQTGNCTVASCTSTAQQHTVYINY